ncbi:MAG: trigger factor [Planctomycetota bacterium]
MSASDPTTNGDGGVTAEIVDEGPCRKRIRTQIPASDVESEVNSSYSELRKNVQMPGFRKGKVPRSVLERKYGEQILDDVRDELMRTSFQEQLEKEKLRVIGSPNFDKVEFEAGQPFSYEAVFDVAPEFDLPEYKGLELRGEPTDVADAEVDSEIEALREQAADFVDTDSPTEEDYAEANVALGGDSEDAIDREGVLLKIGDERVDNISVEGLAAKLVAASPGDELEFEVEVADDFPRESLRGKTALSVKVTGFKRRTLPELDEEFAGRFQVDSVDTLRSEVRKSLEHRRRSEEDNRQEEALLDLILDEAEMDLPESIVDAQRRDLAQNLRYQMAREGKPEEEIEATIEADKTLDEKARRELKKIFVLEKIAEKEVVLVTEDEILRRVAEIAQAMGRDLGEVFEEYRSRGMLAELRAGMIREKVRAFLRKKAKVETPGGSGGQDEDSGDSESS